MQCVRMLCMEIYGIDTKQANAVDCKGGKCGAILRFGGGSSVQGAEENE